MAAEREMPSRGAKQTHTASERHEKGQVEREEMEQVGEANTGLQKPCCYQRLTQR
jgi:hypothetical protein